MTPKRAIYTAVLVVSLGFSIAVAVNRASAQDLSTRNELTAQPNLIPSGAVGTRVGAIDNGDSVPKSQPGNIWPPAEARGQRNPLWAIPMGSLNATRERPIFSSSRRPPSVADRAPQTPQLAPNNAQKRPLLTLVGTVTEEGEGIAVFRDENSKDILRLQTGESHLGWTLSAVKPREVTMLHDRDAATLVIPSPPAN
jgi:general secretion pathway protein N